MAQRGWSRAGAGHSCGGGWGGWKGWVPPPLDHFPPPPTHCSRPHLHPPRSPTPPTPHLGAGAVPKHGDDGLAS